MIKTLTRDDIADILNGATIFGAGGGGELAEGFELIDAAIAAGKTFRLATLDDVPDDALICTPYLLGAISDLPPEEAQLYAGLPQTDTHPILLAYRRLQTLLDKPIYGAVPCELGGSNTAVPFFVAAMEGGVVVDADPAGRAVPEITHASYYLAGLPAAPIAAANAFGEVMVLENIRDDRRAETIVRALSRVSRNDIAAVDHALPAKTLRPAIIPGTISQAQSLGAIWRQGRSDPMRLPAQIASAAKGIVAFTGQISASDWRTDAGFTLGTFEISGDGAFAGQNYRVTLKNENMASWLNGTLHATIPDIITLLDTQTGEVVTNPHATQLRPVAVLILPAPALFRTEKGLAAFGPSYAELDAPFNSPLGT